MTKSVSRHHDVVIAGLTSTASGVALVGITTELDKSYEKKFGTRILDLAVDLGATPEPDSVVVLPKANNRVVIVGLGDPDVDPDRIRQAVSNAARRVSKFQGATGLTVAVSMELSDPELLQAAGEAAILGQYECAKISLDSRTSAIKVFEIISVSAKAEAKQAITRAKVIADAVCAARDLVNAPPNLLYPESFVTEARALVKSQRIDVEVLDEKALEKGGYGGLLAVGGGSARKPRLLRLDYSPRGAKTRLNLVGKGITFDSGGLDIKPADGMLSMKCDMGGAAAVVMAVQAIAALGLKIRVTAYAALAENMPSGSAYRPSDVLTMFDGQTVENYNTDAEGRLVLADALARSNADNPDLVVDVATLTGACVVALGERCSGVMASDNQTADRILDAAEMAGEEFWQLPLTSYTRRKLDSQIADTRSGGKSRYGGAMVAAAFLQRFIDEGRPWAHLDIAGPAYNDAGPYDETPSGGTGVGVRTLVALATSLAS